METAQELDTAGVWNDDTTHKVSLAAAEALKEATHTRSTVRWLAVVIALQLLVLCGMGYGALVLKHQVEGIRETGVAQHEAASQQIAAIETQTKELAYQVQGLRSLLASDTAEDVIFLKIMVLKPRVDPELARTIAASIHHHARQYGRDPDLVLAIMAVESAFNPEAVSRVGAVGLMQVMPHWKEVLAIKGDLKDVDVSVKYGLQILAFYEQMYKDLEMALTAYNRGPGPVDRALMKGKSSDNGYAPRVLAVYERLKGLRAGATAKGERL